MGKSLKKFELVKVATAMTRSLISEHLKQTGEILPLPDCIYSVERKVRDLYSAKWSTQREQEMAILYPDFLQAVEDEHRKVSAAQVKRELCATAAESIISDALSRYYGTKIKSVQFDRQKYRLRTKVAFTGSHKLLFYTNYKDIEGLANRLEKAFGKIESVL